MVVSPEGVKAARGSERESEAPARENEAPGCPQEPRSRARTTLGSSAFRTVLPALLQPQRAADADMAVSCERRGCLASE